LITKNRKSRDVQKNTLTSLEVSMIFRKNSPTALEKYFSKIDFEQANWLTFAVNQPELIKNRTNSHFVAQFEVHCPNSTHTLAIDIQDNNRVLVEAWSGSKNLFKGQIDNQIFLSLFSDYFDNFMKTIRAQLIEMAKKESEQAINPTNEPQGIEWIKTSLTVLQSALGQAFPLDQEKSTRDTHKEEVDDNVFAILLFSGKQPNSRISTFRLRIFNLDFDLIEDKTNTLRLRVLNKGRSETFHGVEPTFSGFFTRSKNELSDQFIQLLIPLAKAFYSSAWKELPKIR
jgi:glutamyl/glutaminyl-tRNA synthetase